MQRSEAFAGNLSCPNEWLFQVCTARKAIQRVRSDPQKKASLYSTFFGCAECSRLPSSTCFVNYCCIHTPAGAPVANPPLAVYYVFKLPPWSLRLLSRSLAPRNLTPHHATPRHATHFGCFVVVDGMVKGDRLRVFCRNSCLKVMILKAACSSDCSVTKFLAAARLLMSVAQQSRDLHHR